MLFHLSRKIIAVKICRIRQIRVLFRIPAFSPDLAFGSAVGLVVRRCIRACPFSSAVGLARPLMPDRRNGARFGGRQTKTHYPTRRSYCLFAFWIRFMLFIAGTLSVAPGGTALTFEAAFRIFSSSALLGMPPVKTIASTPFISAI